MNAKALKICLVGPLPPPPGGMANQTRQLARLLEAEGIAVEVVRANAPYQPQWVASLRGVRALFRLAPFLIRLWRAAGRVDLFHVMANSGWAWHFFAAPAVWIAKLRRVPVVINYRGGEAEEFFSRSFRVVGPTLRLADRLAVPSGFLQRVFARFGLSTTVVPNVVDLGRFLPRPENHASPAGAPHLIVTRNLEAIYDVSTALRAFAIVTNSRPGATMTIAGSGPEHEKLAALALELGVANRVTFAGRLDNDGIGELYRRADLFLNSSLVDNMPISILEALASGVPVVTTNVGGIPFVVEHGKSALMVAPGDPEAMARAILELIDDPARAAQLVGAGRELVQQYSWTHVRSRWFAVYSGLVPQAPGNAAAEAK